MADDGDFLEAKDLYRSGRYREARARFEELIDASPHPGLHCYWAGLASRELGEFGEAADHLYLASHHLPGDERVWLALGESLLGAGRAEEALDALQKAESVSADPVPALRVGARALKSLGRHDEAVANMARVAAERPDDAVDCSVYALALLRAGRIDAAHAASLQALRIDADCVEANHHAGLIAREKGALGRAASLFGRAFAARPQSPEIRSALAHALRDLGRTDAAIAHYDAVLAADPAFADAALNRAYLLLMQERYAEGWDAYECRFAFADGPQSPRGIAPWSGKGGERILVFGEQGIGDQVMFASCIPDLLSMAGSVTIACHPRLVSLFARSFPTATVQAQDGPANRLPDAEATVSIASLPRFFRRSRDAFPAKAGYLRADPARIERWSSQFGAIAGRRNVGLAWRGGSLRTRRHLRSVPPATLASLGDLAGVRWISLQYGDVGADVVAMRAAGMQVDRWPEIENDMEDCAAAICAVDRIVSIDNTIAHLSGALGRSVRILVNAGAEWRYGLEGDTMPWYPSARLYRQRESEDWSAAMEAACAGFAGGDR